MNLMRFSKRRIRIIVDIAMAVLVILMMSYSLIGERNHEILGIILLLLFILHHFLNLNWWKNLFKGKYSPVRIFQTFVDLELLLFMIAQPLSGILISKYLFTSLSITSLTALAREVHLSLAYWGFIFLFLHAGIHLITPVKKIKNLKIKKILLIIVAVISIYGIYIFIKESFLSYMILIQKFYFEPQTQSLITFFIQNLAVAMFIAMLGLGTEALIIKITKREKK